MDRRRELREQYKNRTVTGGVYRIVNRENGKYLLKCDSNLQGSQNRHRFSVEINSCCEMKLQRDWKEFGGGVFDFDILETLEKKPEQADREFNDDLAVLRELWREKFDPALSY